MIKQFFYFSPSSLLKVAGSTLASVTIISGSGKRDDDLDLDFDFDLDLDGDRDRDRDRLPAFDFALRISVGCDFTTVVSTSLDEDGTGDLDVGG